MTQKVIEVVGTSKESFAKAAENAVTEAARTVRGLKWARVAELEMELDGKKIAQYPRHNKDLLRHRTVTMSVDRSTGRRENRFLEGENWGHTNENAPDEQLHSCASPRLSDLPQMA